MKNERKIDLFDRRRGGDNRRCWRCDYDYPFIDSHGMLVTEDRRKNIDRRTEMSTSATIHQLSN